MNEKNDKVIPEVEFYLTPPIEVNDGYLYGTRVLVDSKELLLGSLKTKKNTFQKDKKPKKATKSIACALAYYLALAITKGNSNQATEMACDWLTMRGIKITGGDIRRARRDRIPPKSAVFLLCTEPLGIMVLFEPKK